MSKTFIEKYILNDIFVGGFVGITLGSILIMLIKILSIETENKPQQIHKENVTIEIKDTLQIDNRNFTIIVIDSIEYLCYKSGAKLELIKHK